MSADATIRDVLDGRARWCVVHGDNREVLPGVPLVDHVITDPPFTQRTSALRDARAGQLSLLGGVS